jgi:hypothetical protein
VPSRLSHPNPNNSRSHDCAKARDDADQESRYKDSHQLLVPDWVVVVAMIKTSNASDNQNLVRRRAVWPLADSASD